MTVQNPALLPLILLDRRPVAIADIRDLSHSVRGNVQFFKTPLGTVISAELRGQNITAKSFHLRISHNCREETVPLSLLCIKQGGAALGCITRRFSVEDILEKTVEVRDTAICANGRIFSVSRAQSS